MRGTPLHRGRWVLATGTVILMLAATLQLAGVAVSPSSVVPSIAGTHSSAVSPGLPAGTSPLPEGPTISSPSHTVPSSDPSAVGIAALAAAHGAGVSSRDVFVPRAGASPAQEATTAAHGYVAPLYSSAPAPMGVAYYGLSSGAGGQVIPTVLNTSALQGSLALTGPGIQPLSVYDSSPDYYSVQLNGVTTNVSLFGTSGYEFWTQNVIEYGYQAKEMYLITNVWNFSSPSAYLSPNVFYGHGPNGFQVGTSYYFAVLGPFSVSYPFTVTLTMTSELAIGRDAVYFSTAITTANGTTSYPDWDYVIFNSRAPGGPFLTAPSSYTADGYQYNPLGLTNDFEMMIGGPGGGSQADIFAAQGTLSLAYWNATRGSFASVPAAFDYAGETGETATGVTESWNDTATGPVANLDTGPSILGGLWNAGQPAGEGAVTVAVHPSNAFLFFAPVNTTNFTAAFPPEWAPSVTTSTFELAVNSLANDAYGLTVMLSGFLPQTLTVSVNATPQTISVSLVRNASIGIYTPLWAWSNSVEQFSAISSHGRGTAHSPWVLQNVQTSEISFLFGIVNDYTFPVYPGVFLIGTTAPVMIYHAAPMEVESPYADLPSANDMPYVLYDTSNVSIDSSTIGPTWWTSYPISIPYYATASIVLWNSTFDLIANDTIDYTFIGVYLYGGGNNTFWGNSLYPTSPPPGAWALPLVEPLMAFEDGESGDLIYNNAFTDAAQLPDLITAYTPNFDLYSGAPANFTETWNLSVQPASNVHFAQGYFPTIPLYGNILGYSTQGGNYWFDYDSTVVLPYDAFGYITNGGDYAPYLANVTVSASPGSVTVASERVTFLVGGHLLNGLGTLALATSEGALLGIWPVAIQGGVGSLALVPGLLLPAGETALTFWVTVPDWNLVSSVGTLMFLNATAPAFLSLSVTIGPLGLLDLFTVTSDGANVAVLVYAANAAGTTIAVYSVPLGPSGVGAIVLEPATLGLTTYWWVEYGSVASNVVTVGVTGFG